MKSTYLGTILLFSKIRQVNGCFLFEKERLGVSRANFEKYLGTFLLFHLRRGWVGGKIEIFEKSPYVTLNQSV